MNIRRSGGRTGKQRRQRCRRAAIGKHAADHSDSFAARCGPIADVGGIQRLVDMGDIAAGIGVKQVVQKRHECWICPARSGVGKTKPVFAVVHDQVIDQVHRTGACTNTPSNPFLKIVLFTTYTGAPRHAIGNHHARATLATRAVVTNQVVHDPCAWIVPLDLDAMTRIVLDLTGNHRHVFIALGTAEELKGRDGIAFDLGDHQSPQCDELGAARRIAELPAGGFTITEPTAAPGSAMMIIRWLSLLAPVFLLEICTASL